MPITGATVALGRQGKELTPPTAPGEGPSDDLEEAVYRAMVRALRDVQQREAKDSVVQDLHRLEALLAQTSKSDLRRLVAALPQTTKSDLRRLEALLSQTSKSEDELKPEGNRKA